MPAYVPHERVYLFPAGEAGDSMTQQHFSDDADINTIMRKYSSHGIPPGMVDSPGSFGDFTGSSDYLTSHLKVLEAQKRFMELPAEVRAHFDNDPAKLLDAVYNPTRKGELVKLGLVTLTSDEKAFLKAASDAASAQAEADARDLAAGRAARLKDA